MVKKDSQAVGELLPLRRRPPDLPAPESDELLVQALRARHPDASAHLEAADVLVDAMRGRFQTWTRIRVNLQHVPLALRPAPEPLDPDDAPDDWVTGPGRPHRRRSRARTAR